MSASIACAAQTAEAPRTVPDTLAQRLLACTACHGREGRASNIGYLPRIAGKPAGYLYNQLLNFRDGRRANAAMAALLNTLSDDYLREIAAHFAALDLPYPTPPPASSPPATLARGRVLIESGDASRGIPACMACHGTTMMGTLPATPGLLGLPRDYLLGQMGAWKTGQRRASPPDCMARVVEKLDEADIGALVAWLSTQAPPGGAKPLGPADRPLPLECGSVVH